MNLRRLPGALPALALLALGACTDRSPVGTAQPVPARRLELRCTVHVRDATLACHAPPLAAGESLGDRIIGGNDIYVKLASSNLAYSTVTEIFSADVTVENLMSVVIGTTDGTTVKGVRVFFHTGPTRTGGTGSVSLRNADSTATFTETMQPYYIYREILQPMETSAARTWEFDVDDTVTSFSFGVYVSAPMVDESSTVALRGHVWTGAVDAAWSLAGNWMGSQVPDSASVVTVPADSLLASTSYPVLGADARVAALRVGGGSTLTLGGFTLQSTGSVDVGGSVLSGLLRLSGTASELRGNVPALSITGSTHLQGAVKATGPVAVTGSLHLNGVPLSIAVP